VFSIVTQIKAAKPDAFAISWTVHDKACNSASDEVSHALEVLNLFGDIEAIEENNRRYFA